MLAQRQAVLLRPRRRQPAAQARLRPGGRRLRRDRRLRRAAAVSRLSHRHGAVRRRLPAGAGAADDIAPMGGAGGDRGRHVGRDLPGVRALPVRAAAARHAGRTGEPCSSCSATAFVTVLHWKYLLPLFAGHARRRRGRRPAGRHHHHDDHRAPALHLRAGAAGGAGGDDRRLRRRLGGRAHHRLPDRHSRHAVGDRHHLRRLSRWRARASPAARCGSACGRRSSAGWSAACS